MKEHKRQIDLLFQHRLVTHILFWLALLATFTLLASLNSGSVKINVMNNLAMLPAQIGATYLLNYFQIPQLLLKKRYVLFALSLVLSIYIFSVLARITVVYISEPMFREEFVQESILEILGDVSYLILIYFPGIYIYALIMLIAKAVKKRFEEKHQIEVLEKEKIAHELKFLKAQMQPHFLFNTLNNLYALTLAKSDAAPAMVLKLSELLDFIIYQSNEPSIKLSKEIELINGLIELERLRYGDYLDVDFNHSQTSDAVTIAPLTLIPLVENAFKHGITGSEKNEKITMSLSEIDNVLVFQVKNALSKKPQNEPNKKKGIGIPNLKRQLKLNYPEKHTLEIQSTDDFYSVRLQIKLV